MNPISKWEKASAVATIIGVVVSIVSVVVASGMMNRAEICLSAKYKSGQPAADAVLIHGKDRPIVADNFGRFVCPATWMGAPATLCTPSGQVLAQIPALLNDSVVDIPDQLVRTANGTSASQLGKSMPDIGTGNPPYTNNSSTASKTPFQAAVQADKLKDIQSRTKVSP